MIAVKIFFWGGKYFLLIALRAVIFSNIFAENLIFNAPNRQYHNKFRCN